MVGAIVGNLGLVRLGLNARDRGDDRPARPAIPRHVAQDLLAGTGIGDAPQLYRLVVATAWPSRDGRSDLYEQPSWPDSA